MQKQFSSISETVQSSQNSSNSCTVQSLQFRFNTKLMSVRQIRHARPASSTRSAHVDGHTAPARSEGCEVRSDTPRSCRCPSLVYRPDCRSGCRWRPHQHDQHDQRRRRRRLSCRRQHHTLSAWCSEHRHCDLRSVSTTRVHGPSSRAELSARELG